MADLPPELHAEIGTMVADAQILPRRRAEDDARLSGAIRRRATMKRVRQQTRALAPHVEVGGAYGDAVKRHRVWRELKAEQGWMSVGGGPDFDACDLVLKYQQFEDELKHAGIHVMPVKEAE